MSKTPSSRSRASRRVVVTAGPTREHLDDIRFLSNASTGRMGHLIAREAARHDAEVTLILGPSRLPRLEGVTTIGVVSTKDLLEATREAARGADLAIFAAAPSDWTPARRRKGKPPREGGAFSLDLRPTADVAAVLGRRKGSRVHVGFALEIEPDFDRAREKMRRKRFDAIVLNHPANFAGGGGPIWWLSSGGGEPEPLPASSKAATARAVVRRSFDLLT